MFQKCFDKTTGAFRLFKDVLTKLPGRFDVSEMF
jgi:hypothetical protein